MFQMRRQGMTLESMGTVVFFLIVVCVVTWGRYRRIVYEVAPTFLAVKHGPSGFPLTIEIQRAGLKVTNDSSDVWRPCEIVIGGQQRSGMMFALESRGAVELPYGKFFVVAGAPVRNNGYERARDHIGVQCTDSSGKQHLMDF